ncbi:hypothetical protein GUJ93_ZPchr0011g28823 [Zizania palustris]|uniref:Uncharacterized protein n=1 Tax=Zizania palustris TaxID=103762 RepID=A0A8J5WG66_ZIZPA|nr:hypothetical protein GUJ93_ZPchr0011g28823 [Zizania palustris]
MSIAPAAAFAKHQRALLIGGVLMVVEHLSYKDLHYEWLVFVLHHLVVSGIGVPSNLCIQRRGIGCYTRD